MFNIELPKPITIEQPPAIIREYDSLKNPQSPSEDFENKWIKKIPRSELMRSVEYVPPGGDILPEKATIELNNRDFSGGSQK